MKTFKQYIKEALDRPYKTVNRSYTKTDRYGTEKLMTVYLFKTENGRPGKIIFDLDVKDNTVWIDFEIDNMVSMTGDGDQFRIFATVKSAVLDYVKKTPVDEISFTGSKAWGDNRNFFRSGRGKLYTRFMKMLASHLNMKGSHYGDGSSGSYTLLKK